MRLTFKAATRKIEKSEMRSMKRPSLKLLIQSLLSLKSSRRLMSLAKVVTFTELVTFIMKQATFMEQAPLMFTMKLIHIPMERLMHILMAQPILLMEPLMFMEVLESQLKDTLTLMVLLVLMARPMFMRPLFKTDNSSKMRNGSSMSMVRGRRQREASSAISRTRSPATTEMTDFLFALANPSTESQHCLATRK